jgi:membrane protein DedA with SNARE-associated domain/rhodanese-related sulfurtransferase
VTAASHLTYGGVFLAVLAEQLCLPIPSPLFLIAAGALSSQGQMRTSIIVFMGVAGCLAADQIWFWLGRRWGSQTVRLLCRFTADPRSCSQNALQKFRRYGLPVVCVAKFVPGLNLVMPPLLGAEGVSLPGFLAVDTSGAFLWSAFYVGVGYLFCNEVNVAMHWVKHFGTVLSIVIVALVSVYAGRRGLVLVRMIRRLRVRRISPAMLARKLNNDRKVAVLDLLDFELETDDESAGAIPGAFRVDPSHLRTSPHIAVPDNVDIVLYSSSGGDAVPARAAIALHRIGIDNVWVLQGGLKAWREQGFPVSKSPEVPEVAAARVGVKLPTP